MLGFESRKVGALHVIQNEWWAKILLQVAHFNVAHLYALKLTNKKAVRWGLSEHHRLRVVLFLLRWVECRLFFCAAPLVVNSNIVKSDILNGMPRNPADN